MAGAEKERAALCSDLRGQMIKPYTNSFLVGNLNLDLHLGLSLWAESALF